MPVHTRNKFHRSNRCIMYLAGAQIGKKIREKAQSTDSRAKHADSFCASCNVTHTIIYSLTFTEVFLGASASKL